jgi:hypothetical protein
MATGKKVKDLFGHETKTPDIGLEVAPRQKVGRPKAVEKYQKVTVILFDRQVIALDKIATAIFEKERKHVKRAELIRLIVDQAVAGVQPDKPGFDKAVRSLASSLK